MNHTATYSECSMKYYQLRLANNEVVPPPIQFVGYKVNFLWPLQEQASRLQRLFQKLVLALLLLCYAGTIFAEFTFIGENLKDIPAIVDCLSTSLVGFHYATRITVLSLRQSRMRVFLQRFYSEIYFTRTADETLYRSVRRIMLVISLYTMLYSVLMILIVTGFIIDVFRQDISSPSKPYFYRMSFAWYDAQAPFAYVFTTIYTGWLAFSCVLLMSADDYFLYLVLVNTTYCYKKLQKDLHEMLEACRQQVARSIVQGRGGLHSTFRRRLHEVVRRQQRLDSFVAAAKSYFRYQIFCNIFFGTLLLCVVSFQFKGTTISVGWLKYVVWLISQTSHLIMSGHFGQMLVDETSAMHNSFFACQWEFVLLHGDVGANKSLVQDIKFAIFHAQHAAFLDGMHIFPLTNGTIGSALRSALSYFMFLNKVYDMKKLH